MMLISGVSLLSRRIQLKAWNQLSVVANYSRKSNSNYDESFKIVGRKGTESKDEVANANIGVNPNWELLTPQGFRFYLPGNTGPAWQDVHTSANTNSPMPLLDESSSLVCTVQECPILLRQGVYELFAGAEVYGQLTVVTLSQKPRSKAFQADTVETEQLAKQFLLAAQDICSKLKMAGFWADFINPFSGRPYVAPLPPARPLYQTDPRFRCLGFRITDKNRCKVIADKSSKSFVGSLFTTAPPSTTLLRDILQHYED